MRVNLSDIVQMKRLEELALQPFHYRNCGNRGRRLIQNEILNAVVIDDYDRNQVSLAPPHYAAKLLRRLPEKKWKSEETASRHAPTCMWMIVLKG
jgi:hypothetical protein